MTDKTEVTNDAATDAATDAAPETFAPAPLDEAALTEQLAALAKAKAEQASDGTDGQDREAYTDDQDRDSYTVDDEPHDPLADLAADKASDDDQPMLIEDDDAPRARGFGPNMRGLARASATSADKVAKGIVKKQLDSYLPSDPPKPAAPGYGGGYTGGGYGYGGYGSGGSHSGYGSYGRSSYGDDDYYDSWRKDVRAERSGRGEGKSSRKVTSIYDPEYDDPKASVRRTYGGRGAAPVDPVRPTIKPASTPIVGSRVAEPSLYTHEKAVAVLRTVYEESWEITNIEGVEYALIPAADLDAAMDQIAGQVLDLAETMGLIVKNRVAGGTMKRMLRNLLMQDFMFMDSRGAYIPVREILRRS